MKGPFLSLYMNHTYHITYSVQLYSSEKEYSGIFIMYFILYCIYVFLNISYIQPLKKYEGNKP